MSFSLNFPIYNPPESKVIYHISTEYEGESQQALECKYDCLLFDLDDTLYPLSSGLSANITKNIQEYMIQKLGIEESKVPELCKALYINYGTTMAGLRAVGCRFDYDDFHSFVHGRLPYNMLKPDHVLKNLLHSLPIRKVVFTNSDKNHASRVLSRLGLEDCFEQIICFETLNNTDKGSDAVGEDEMGVFDINQYTASPNLGLELELPKTPLFFDDSIRNLVTGKRLGLTTVWVDSTNRAEGVDHALESIHNMKEALPELWEATEKSEKVRYSGEVAIEEHNSNFLAVCRHQILVVDYVNMRNVT